MLRAKKTDDTRIFNDPFKCSAVFEVRKPEVSEFPPPEEATVKENYSWKFLYFTISYNPQPKAGPTEEIITFGDEAMLDQLLCGLYNRGTKDVFGGRSPQKKRKLSYDFSNIDYYEAVIEEVGPLTENEGRIPSSIFNLLIEKGIDKEKFVEGFSDSIKYRRKESKRKREEESDEEIQSKFSNYISYLADLRDFSSRCEAVINGDEGVFSMELTLKTLDKKVDAFPPPLSVLDFHKKLKNWALGKVLTLFNKKIQLM
jgi:hypothetical protein